MELSFAPMEGVTYYTYRNLHHEMFRGADVYFAPFIAPDSTGSFKAGSLRDILPENNPDIHIIPQILANNPDAFLSIAGEFAAMGYREVNLNAGCPSGCVFSKHKGAGMLSDLSTLDTFLDRVFSACPLKISVKTRMGVKSTEEFPEILSIYNKYPFSELIIHARDRSGMYKSQPDRAGALRALDTSGLNIVYNGNIYRAAEFRIVTAAAPRLHGVMIGRGAVSSPSIFREINGGQPLEKAELKEFHDRYLSETLATGLSEYFTVNRMKELWYYMEFNFRDASKYIKAINKCRNAADYRSAADLLFANAPFDPTQGFGH